MRRRRIIAALLLSLAPAALAGGPKGIVFPKELPELLAEKPIPVPSVATSILPNGMTLWVVRRPGLPLVQLRLVVKGGRTLDPAGRPGFANLLASALREGTKTRSSTEIAARLQGAGGELATAAGDDSLVVATSGLRERAGLLVDTLADVVRNPAFPTKAIERLRTLALEELATDETDPYFLAGRAFRKLVYGGHPYGVSTPSKETTESLRPELLAREAARRLVPERTLLLVAGDVEPGEIAAAAAAAFGGWPRGSERLPESPEAVLAPDGGAVHVVARPGSVQTVLFVGTLGLSRPDPDYFPLEVAMGIYGGAFSSRIVSNLREEKGYTYSPGASSHDAERRGLVRTYAAVRNEVTGASLNEVLYEMNRMATTDVTDEELERVRRHETGTEAVALQTAGGLADELAGLWRNGLPPSEIGRFVERIQAVGKADVRRVARHYLASGAARLLAVGDPDIIREELSPLVPAVELSAPAGRKESP